MLLLLLHFQPERELERERAASLHPLWAADTQIQVLVVGLYIHLQPVADSTVSLPLSGLRLRLPPSLFFVTSNNKVPLDSRFSEIEIRSNETVVCSDITSSSGKRVWCQLTRNSDLCSAKIKNKSSSAILVDGAMVQNNNVVSIKCGSEIVPGSVGKGHLKYKFEVMPVQVLQDVSGQRILKISMDVEHAKCSICLSVWHDVVTAAPCLHNFCNGCFSEWLRRCQEKRTSTLYPQCRGVKQFVGRNHFLRNIEEDILKADPSLRRPKDELGVLDSHMHV